MGTTTSRARHTSREDARERLTRTATEHRDMAEKMRTMSPYDHRRPFCTYDPDQLADYAEWCLRWIDCAPEGANHLIAPLQGWDGTPMGGRNPLTPWGTPGPDMRAAYEARGVNWMDRRREQYERMVAARAIEGAMLSDAREGRVA